MPAENIIATHETVRNSGSSPSPPSGMLPYLLAASQMTKTTKPDATSEKSQPVLWTTNSRPDGGAVLRLSVLSAPQRTNAMATAAATPKTTLSTRERGASSWSTGGGSSAGCSTSSGLLVSSLIRHGRHPTKVPSVSSQLRVTDVSWKRPLCRRWVDQRKTSVASGRRRRHTFSWMSLYANGFRAVHKAE